MIEYKHLTRMDLDFLGVETQKVVSNMPVLNGRSKKMNMHEVMRPVGALIEAIRNDKSRYVSDEDLRQKVGRELLIYSHLYFLSQYDTEPYACMEEFKKNLDWVFETNLTEEQRDTLCKISDSISGYLEKFKEDSAEVDFLDSIKSLNFCVTSAKLNLDSDDPRYAAIDEISMLATFVMLFGDEHYSAFKNAINVSCRRKMELNIGLDNYTEKKMNKKIMDNGFNRSIAEDAVQEYIEVKLGWPLEMFESKTPGVIAIERPSYIDEDKIDFEELAEFVSAKVGIDVVAIEHCDWTFDDGCDEEAIYIAFDIPELEPDYRNSNCNLVKNGQPTSIKT